MTRRVRVTLGGAVQGVGFRPFVFRLAQSLALTGFARNTPGGLRIEVEGEPGAVARFLERLEAERPRAAAVFRREVEDVDARGSDVFRIEASEAGTELSAVVLPDMAPCPACLGEIADPEQRRYQYPFTNCTECGPRFTIVTGLPYDRPLTTLREFELCDDCRREYEDPNDRRFHAQPIACGRCGPRLSLAVEAVAPALGAGAIVALKGVGGYQLLVDARNQEAVLRLRERKHREWKPFAVMMPSLEVVRAYAEVGEEEARLLASPQSPIVLLRARREAGIAHAVANGSPWLGVMLPPSPLHALLMEQFAGPVVATSGNLSDEPIVTEEDEAEKKLGEIADLFVHHNRPIARHCDDSVARVSSKGTTILRRARGYAPMAIPVRDPLPRVLAVGGHLKSTIALAMGRQVVVSQHIGDLDTPEARTAFERTIEEFCRLYQFEPELIACDLHPDYYPTRWALSRGLPARQVQHHHAHAASCAAENGIEGAYVAASWDGTGYGTDGTIWGGEIFSCEGGKMERAAHLRPFLLPGGDAAAKQCWRSAAGVLHAMGLPLPEEARALAEILEKRIRCVETTSMGRLFDAVGALTGIAAENRFEGESGLRLEAAAWNAGVNDAYPLEGGDWRELMEAVRKEPSAEVASGRFHNALAVWLSEEAVRAGAAQVALSGGCFQNAYLTQRVEWELAKRDIAVFVQRQVPPNDGGISLGQAVLAGC